MDKFFSPESVAVIGATNSLFNLGGTICNMLKHIQYEGRVYAVNPRGEDSYGCAGFAAVHELPEAVDLAIIIVTARLVPGIVRECGQKGVRRLIIQSAGFAEEGEGGRALQEEVNTAARDYGMRFIGPNCLGLMDAHSRFCCFFGASPERYGALIGHPGSVSYVVQSGGVGALILESLQADAAKVNKIVSIGNKADVDEADLIEYFQHDNTEVVGLYLENVRDGNKLLQVARSSTKPILVYKVGRTQEGARAAMSHTAGMANNDAVFESVCRQAGIIRVESISELYSMPKIFTTMPPLKGRRIAVFTNTGALGGIGTDLLVSSGMQMASIPQETQARLKQTGTVYNATNPIDLGVEMSIQTYLDIFEILLATDTIDGLLPIPNVWQDFVIEAIVELVKMCHAYHKPAAIYIPNTVEKIISIRSTHDLPVFLSLEEAVRALSISYQYYTQSQKREVGVSAPSARRRGAG